MRGDERSTACKKAFAFLAEAKLVSAWNIYVQEQFDSKEKETLHSIVSKLVERGNISSKQVNYLRVLTNKVLNAKTAKDFPHTEERFLVRGKILAIKEPDEWSMFLQLKITIQHADGWTVFGSMPTPIKDQARIGDIVEFYARLTPHKTDRKTGYFSRPSKARIVS